MRWFQWYPTRGDVMGILFVLVVTCLLAFVLMWFPNFHQRWPASGFGLDWDCKIVPNGEPICIKKPGH